MVCLTATKPTKTQEVERSEHVTSSLEVKSSCSVEFRADEFWLPRRMCWAKCTLPQEQQGSEPSSLEVWIGRSGVERSVVVRFDAFTLAGSCFAWVCWQRASQVGTVIAPLVVSHIEPNTSLLRDAMSDSWLFTTTVIAYAVMPSPTLMVWLQGRSLHATGCLVIGSLLGELSTTLMCHFCFFPVHVFQPHAPCMKNTDFKQVNVFLVM